MKSLIKTTLTLAALFTPAVYVILPAIAVCLVTDFLAWTYKPVA
jgi:hypothetical protein